MLYIKLEFGKRTKKCRRAVLDKLVREGLTENMAFNWSPERRECEPGKQLGKNVPDRKDSKGSGPEMEMSLVSLKNSKEASQIRTHERTAVIGW